MREIIDVNLYGGPSIFKGRETPMEAVVTTCDTHHDCSFYRDGHCLALRGFLTAGCKHGGSTTHKGYTSRARKFGEFRNKWASHEKYNQLSRPPKKLGIIAGEVYFPYEHVIITEDCKVKEPDLGSRPAYIPLDKFTIDLIEDICLLRPQAFFGGTIASYQKETVPLFLAHLKEVLPDLYKQFKEAHPELVRDISYVGRKALLRTIKPSKVHYKSKNYPDLNEEWEWDGDYLHYTGGRVSSVNVTRDYEIVDFILKPTDKSVITIEDDSQVQDSTVFVD